MGYDETQLAEGRHPDRHALDAAAPHHPVRLQHRSLHLDVLNTLALRLTGLWTEPAPRVERDPATGEPTGRLYHAAELLRARLPHPTEEELARDVRAVSERLLAWGVTSVQDASVTNGVAEWDLFRCLAARGALRVRLFFFPGVRHWREVLAYARPGPHLALGPVKLVLQEGVTDPAEARALVAEVHAAGYAVAVHAVSEAEVALALAALRGNGERAGLRSPDRLEHGAVIPDAYLGELRAAGVVVVGQPALVYERGDIYRALYPPERHGWLHRARSLLRAGIPYAAGSDAPVTEPAPGLGLFAARRRQTQSKQILGPDELLSRAAALAAFTLEPARAVGADRYLGLLRPGMLVDIAVLDAAMLERPSLEIAWRPARLTLMEGRVVWQRPDSDAPA